MRITSTPRVRSVPPEEFPAYEAYNNGVALNRIGDYDGAERAYILAISLKPRLPEAYQNLALIYDGRGNVEASEYCNRMAIDTAEDDEYRFKALVMTNLAMGILRRQSSNDTAVGQALELLIQAQEIDPTNEDVLFNLGSAYFNLKEYNLANQTFTKLLDINPQNGKSTSFYIQIYCILG